MTDPIRVANCSGFFGDRLSAAVEMVESGPIDVLTGDWLAELTMFILARTQAKRPGGGYARTFVTQMEQVMGSCIDKDIKVVTNAGGLDPASCAEAVAQVADTLGLAPSIAFVEGDNLLPRLDELKAAGVSLDHFETGEAVGDTSRFISANAYLGCWGIVDALNRGADIVITGRVTDAAVVCGPAAWHHGWQRDDWGALAGAVVAGHVIECGTQATGGNYSFFTELEGLTHTGFPWAEIASDGSCVIGKHEGTGGEVSVGTVTSQLLYEIAGPSYLGPDVNARFDTIRLTQQSRDRVLISETQGEPPPATLKVAMNELGGFRSDISVALTGLDIEAKGELVESAFWAACKYEPEDFDDVTSAVVRTDKPDPASNEEAVASWRLTVKHSDESMLGRPLQSAVNELALATIPGMFGLGGGRPKAFGVYRPALVPAELVSQMVTVDGERRVVESRVPGHRSEMVASVPDLPDLPVPDLSLSPAGDKARVPLGSIIGSRSGDKGGNANLGVFARSAEAFVWLDEFLTTERLRELLPEAAPLPIDRHPLPNIWSLNFVIHGILQEGVAASTRQDAQAKSLGEWLRAREVDVPVELLDT